MNNWLFFQEQQDWDLIGVHILFLEEKRHEMCFKKKKEEEELQEKEQIHSTAENIPVSQGKVASIAENFSLIEKSCPSYFINIIPVLKCSTYN